MKRVGFLFWAVLVGTLVTLCCSPERVGAQAANNLRYSWKPGETYAYAVKVDADLGEVVEELSGHVTYICKAADANSMTLSHQGSLNPHLRTKDGRPVLGAIRFRMFSPLGGVGIGGRFQQSEIKIDPTGKVVAAQGQSQLPFLLGDLLQLVIEPLPANNQPNWEATRPITITEVQNTGRPASRFRPAPTIQRSASERIQYSLGQATGDTVIINKKYELKTDEIVNGAPRLQQTGDGTITFDTKAGVPREMNFKFLMVSNENNVTLRVPVTLKYHRLTEEELEKLRQAQAEALARAQEQARKLAVLTDEELPGLLADLAGMDQKAKAAAERLAKAKPAADDARKAQIAKALDPLLDSKDGFTRKAAVNALEVWATNESVPGLEQSLNDTDHWVKIGALNALAKLHSPESAQAMATLLVPQGERGEAVKALRELGNSAEDAVLPYVEHAEWSVRMEACSLLGDIGSKKSLDAMKGASRDSSGLVAMKAKEAYGKLQARGGKPPPPKAKIEGALEMFGDAQRKVGIGGGGQCGDVSVAGGCTVVPQDAPGVAFGVMQAPKKKPTFTYFIVFKSNFGTKGTTTRFSNRANTVNGAFRGEFSALVNAASLSVVQTMNPAGAGKIKNETLSICGQKYDPAKGRVFIVDLTSTPPTVEQQKTALPKDLEPMQKDENAILLIGNKTLTDLAAANDEIQKLVESCKK
jgi:hypothetical protein